LHEVVDAVGFLNLVAFTALAAVALRQWHVLKARASLWAALTFGALGLVVLGGRLASGDPDTALGHVAERLLIATLVLFPYLLYRFTRAFDPPSRRLELVVGALTGVLIVWTLALPEIPAEDEPRPAWFWAYLVGFLVHWALLSVVVAWRLWHAGRGQPSIARRRMRVLSLAAAAITAAIFLAASGADDDSPVALATGLLALSSAVGFLLGLAPPAAVRYVWRRPEQDRMRTAVSDLMGAVTEEEVMSVVLPPMVRIVGARAVALRAEDGRLVGSHGLSAEARHALESGRSPAADEHHLLKVEIPAGVLLLWTTPYAPYFGVHELSVLGTLGALTSLALDRSRLFAQEREARLVLERADELKTNFVALAAHELRTPVASVRGLAGTLTRLRHRLDDGQRDQVESALDRQSERLSMLVEQLLDLSRLDAEAVRIMPERVAVKRRVEDVVATIAGERAGEVGIDVPPELECDVDPEVLDRVVSNLIANALRHGHAPIRVAAQQTDRHLRVTIEDRGPGVPPEFVPDLFERFTRSEASRDQAGGTGLGLAIARSYARAHRGDLVYEPATPRGARFRVVLPVALPQPSQERTDWAASVLLPLDA
jgi:signal transduction histidine kinase